jgi:hypothetical protein
MKDPVRAKIERYGLDRTINPAHFFPTLDDAVAAFRAWSEPIWAASPPGYRPERLSGSVFGGSRCALEALRLSRQPVTPAVLSR